MDWASESGHYYSRDGAPQYTVIAKNGTERPTTLRDARKHGWVPSVTTITACAARFGLERWKAEQLLHAGLTLPHVEGETEAAWIARVWEDSAAQAKAAAQRGTDIHAAIEGFFRMPCDMGDDPLRPWVESVERTLHQEFGAQEWLPEKSFASPLGYGGKCDLHSPSVIVDFKGKEAKAGVRDWRTYDEHAMQLSAYANGLNLPVKEGKPFISCDAVMWPTAAIIFFDRNEPYSEAHIIKPDDLARGWEMFQALLAYWRAANRYEP
jgi:hypothetical protein